MAGRKPTPKRSPAKRSAKSRAASQAAAKKRPAQQRPNSSTAGREAQEQLAAASMPAVLLLHRLPRWVVIVGPLVVLLLGLLLPYAWAGLFLIVLAAFFGWLIVLAWPRLPGGARVMRVLVVLLLVGAGVAKMLGRLTN